MSNLSASPDFLDLVYLAFVAATASIWALSPVWRQLILILDDHADRRLVRKLLSAEPSWPSGLWGLPAPESYVLLRKFNHKGTDAFKLALLQVVANGTLVIQRDGPAGDRVFRRPGAMSAAPKSIRLPSPAVEEELAPGQMRGVAYRDVPLWDSHHRNHVLGHLHPGDTVELLVLRKDMGMVQVRNATGETGWLRPFELHEGLMVSSGAQSTEMLEVGRKAIEVDPVIREQTVIASVPTGYPARQHSALNPVNPGDLGRFRQVDNRDAELWSDKDRTTVLARLGRGDLVEALSEAALGMIEVRIERGLTGWMKVVELRPVVQEALRAAAMASRLASKAGTTPRTLPEAESEPGTLKGSLQDIYALCLASSDNPTATRIAEEARTKYGSVSQFGTEAVRPELVRQGLCTFDGRGRLRLTRTGEETRTSLEERIAAVLRARVAEDIAPARNAARIALMKAVLTVSLNRDSHSSQAMEAVGDSSMIADRGVQERETGGSSALDAIWLQHWGSLDREVESASEAQDGDADGGDSDGGDGGD